MADEREVLVEVKNLEVTYGSGRKAYKAVKNANFTIYKGETFGLVGESGSGKTTIGRAIMRILPTSGGEVFYKGQKINGKISHALDKQVIKEIQMIFQDPQSSLNERAKVSYIVGEGLMNVRPDLSAAERDEKVRQALLDVRHGNHLRGKEWHDAIIAHMEGKNKNRAQIANFCPQKP